jgi:hypothetical protein
VPLIGDETEESCPCGVRYHLSEGGVYQYEFTVSYKNALYYFDFFPACSTRAGSREKEYFRLTYNHFNLTKKPASVSVLLELNYLPNITPTNVLDKLPTLLTFQ